MHAAYREVGSYRAAAEICGTTPKTVKRSVLAAQAAEKGEIPVVEHNYDAVRDVVIERVERTKGKMSAKRLLPVARAAGYSGSARNFRRLVAEVKARVADEAPPGSPPGIWTPGDMLVFDWGEIGPLFVFCAVMAWSRVRFVYFADNLGRRVDHDRAGPVLRVPRCGAQDRVDRPHGLPEGRHRGRAGHPDASEPVKRFETPSYDAF